ncbi:hypothetical protein F385_990 [Pantoea agglomerans 299R]|nr:hypothetical protein F385_990 [Pantoea agglomerans 299R]
MLACFVSDVPASSSSPKNHVSAADARLRIHLFDASLL